MSRAAAAIDDLFGHVPQHAPELAEPETGEPRERPPLFPDYVVSYPHVPPGGHTPATIRAHALNILAAVREAETMPFGPRELRSHTAIFPYLAEWLKGGEGEALLAEFRGHIERLKAAT